MYRYFDEESSIDLKNEWDPKEISDQSDSEAIKAAVKRAQSGEFDFEKFCKLAGEAGVPVWTNDLVSKQVTYYDHNHQALVIELIPGI